MNEELHVVELGQAAFCNRDEQLRIAQLLDEADERPGHEIPAEVHEIVRLAKERSSETTRRAPSE